MLKKLWGLTYVIRRLSRLELEYEIKELIERFGKYMEVLIGKNLYRTVPWV